MASTDDGPKLSARSSLVPEHRARRSVPECIEEIGLGKAQVLPAALAASFFIGEASELLVSGTIVGMLADLWGISQQAEGMLVAVVFAGFFLGTLASGLVSDAYGRRFTLLLGYLGTAVFGVLPAMTNGPVAFAWLRFLNGIGCGLGVTTSIVYVTELTTKSSRQYVMAATMVAYTVGEIFACGLLLYYTPNLTEKEYWRALIVWDTLPAWLFVMPAFFMLDESPAWLAGQQRRDEACQVLQRMATRNGVTTFEMEGEDLILPPETAGTGDRVHQVLVDHQLRWTTYPLILLLICGNTLNFGLTYFFPILFRENKMEFLPAMHMMLEAVVGLPAAGVSMLVLYSSWGHKTSLLIMGIATAMCTSFIGLLWINDTPQDHEHSPWQLHVATISALLTKLFAVVLFQVSYQFASESFPTPVRGTGLGIVAAFGRVGSIATPAILNSVRGQDNGELTAFVGYVAIFTVIAAVFAQRIPRETKRKELFDFLPPEDRLVGQRRSVLGQEEAPAGALMWLVFCVAMGCGACEYFYIVYAGQMMNRVPAQSKVVCGLMLCAVALPQALWRLGSALGDKCVGSCGIRATMYMRFLIPLLTMAAVMSVLPLCRELWPVLGLGALLGTAGLALRETLDHIALAIDSTCLPSPKVGHCAGGVLLVCVLGLTQWHTPDEDWVEASLSYRYFGAPLVVVVLSFLLVTIAFPSSEETRLDGGDEGRSLVSPEGGARPRGMRAQFKYALRICQLWNEQKTQRDAQAELALAVQNPTPLGGLLLQSAHLVVTAAVLPWAGGFSASAHGCVRALMGWILAEFLGHFIVACTEDVVPTYDAALYMATSLLAIRVVGVVVLEACIVDLFTAADVHFHPSAEIVWFSFFLAGASCVGMLRQKTMEAVEGPGKLRLLDVVNEATQYMVFLTLVASTGIIAARM